MKLPLAYYGNPILRKKGAKVESITDEIRSLVANMIETMHESHGIGIAAPQVHQSLAIFITCPPVEGPDGTFQPGTPKVYINPKILSHGEDAWVHDEACLSIPKLRGDVERPKMIKIQAMDLNGVTFEEELYGWDARVFLHENDHINGVLFIDRIHGKKRKEMEPALREIKKKYN
jgi:peptide deformylase